MTDKHPGGRPRIIQDEAEMFFLFTEYKEKTKKNPIMVHDFVGKDAEEVERRKERPLTMNGFYNYVYEVKGIDCEHYFTNSEGAYDEFLEVCSRIKGIVRQDQIEGGMAGIYNPSITQRLNGLVEKTDNENNNKNSGEIVFKIKS